MSIGPIPDHVPVEMQALLRRLEKPVPPSLVQELDRQRAFVAAEAFNSPELSREQILTTGPPYKVKCAQCAIKFTFDRLPKRCPWCRLQW